MKIKFNDMRLEKDVEIDFSKVYRIEGLLDSKAQPICQLTDGLPYSYMSFYPFCHYTKGSIDDLIKEVYDKGYSKGFEDGSKKMKSEPLTVTNVEDKPTVDIEAVPDEDEHELKGYILSEYKGYVCSAQIVSFKDKPDYVDGIVKAKTIAFTSDGEAYVFDMTIDEFKKVLAKAQEEMK